MSTNDIDLGAILRNKGYRLTAQRQLVLDILRGIGRHATADEIYDRVPAGSVAINRATVYRTLHMLCGIGVVTSTSQAGGQLAYELKPAEQHHHLICVNCGREQELAHALVTPMLDAINTTYDFAVVETLHLSLFGLCACCRSIRDG
jgi:Fur family transcriptional regulator, ferric uptake regulator